MSGFCRIRFIGLLAPILFNICFTVPSILKGENVPELIIVNIAKIALMGIIALSNYGMIFTLGIIIWSIVDAAMTITESEKMITTARVLASLIFTLSVQSANLHYLYFGSTALSPFLAYVSLLLIILFCIILVLEKAIEIFLILEKAIEEKVIEETFEQDSNASQVHPPMHAPYNPSRPPNAREPMRQIPRSFESMRAEALEGPLPVLWQPKEEINLDKLTREINAFSHHLRIAIKEDDFTLIIEEPLPDLSLVPEVFDIASYRKGATSRADFLSGYGYLFKQVAIFRAKHVGNEGLNKLYDKLSKMLAPLIRAYTEGAGESELEEIKRNIDTSLEGIYEQIRRR